MDWYSALPARSILTAGKKYTIPMKPVSEEEDAKTGSCICYSITGRINNYSGSFL